jgi:acetoin:2,6-dichlorophenolindophenol oxidoreductase subunit beta
MRNLKFGDALAEATIQAMEAQPKLFVMGEGVDDPKGSFGTTLAPFKKFGPSRVFDTPLSEGAITGVAIGAALAGTPSLLVHLRCEFALVAMDQLVNHAAKWKYMCGGSVPITIRCVVGRGWGQAAQHSQSFHGMFAQVPGLKVVLPSNAYDAKGLLYSALLDPDPVVCIEHRWLFDKEAPVPEAPYRIPIGKANVVAPGKDLTCAALSYQVGEAARAREILLEQGIEMEIVDMRSVRPLDTQTLLASVRKTGRLIVTDIAHGSAGFCAEVAAAAAQHAFSSLKAPVLRVALPECPTPCSPALEALYYPTVDSLVRAATQVLKKPSGSLAPPALETPARPFLGPF